MSPYNNNKTFILIGAGGHAKVLFSLIKAVGLNVRGVCAPELVSQGITTWRGIEVIGSGDDITAFSPSNVYLINGVGKRVGDTSRQRLFDEFKTKGYHFPSLIHPQAYVDETVELEEGAQVMAGAIIQADARIGRNVIINTHASIDHDCIVEEHVHVSPGAVLCGNVYVARCAFIASGACIIPGVKVGEEAVIGAGASIVRDVLPHEVVLPALIRRNPLVQGNIKRELK